MDHDRVNPRGNAMQELDELMLGKLAICGRLVWSHRALVPRRILNAYRARSLVGGEIRPRRVLRRTSRVCAAGLGQSWRLGVVDCWR